VASHIHAAAKGGPRYDPSQTEEERRGYDNGIWLCRTCGTKIDTDEVKYPAELLRQWRADAESYAREQLGRPSPQVPSEATGVLARLMAIPKGSAGRLSYLTVRLTPHEIGIRFDGVDTASNVFRFACQIGGHGLTTFEAPIADVENVWGSKEPYHFKVTGYLDHTPLEPYQYVSRIGQPPPPSNAAASAAAMSGEAAAAMQKLATAYAEKHPNHHAWHFAFPNNDPVAGELRALGLITQAGSKGFKDTEWRLTDRGQQWVMRHKDG
jgi:hypothetical protein